MKLLHIDASILGARSVSRELSALIVERLAADQDTHVTHRDLAVAAIPHLTVATLPTAHPASKMAAPLDSDAQTIRDDSDCMLQEFMEADVVVIGAPVYNFTVSTQLKAWLDRIIIPGTTFRHSASGVEGLAKGKRVVIALSRGGVYAPGTAAASAEHAETLLRTMFGFIGIAPELVVAEGLNAGPEARVEAVAVARSAIDRLTA
jgi:FMN-dependent NADH-azoreductase